MKQFKRWVIALGIPMAAAALLLCPQIAARAVGRGLRVCAGSILPALFPFFVVTELWISLGFHHRLSRLAAPLVERLFHLPGPTATALLLGLVGGYPVGARTVITLYEDHCLSRQEAQAALRFCNNAGPAFILGVLGGGIFQSVHLGLILWAIHVAATLCLGILFRPAARPHTDAPSPENQFGAFLPALTGAIATGGQTTFQVCIFVLFFSVVAEFFRAFLGQSVPMTLLLGSLELAGGAGLLQSLELPQSAAFVAASALLGWGGLCVHCQSLSALFAAGLSPGPYLSGKALHSLLSLALACLAAPFICSDIPCFGATTHIWPQFPAISWLLAWGILLLLKSSSGKVERNRI